jgi:hypothetical protein
MKFKFQSTFAELYCSRNNCPPRAFRRMIFWRTLPWYAWPLAPLGLLAGSFKSDRGLIDACAGATCMEEIHAEMLAQVMHAPLRVSGEHLRRLAACYLMKETPAARLERLDVSFPLRLAV